ncbi:nucleolar protein 14 homolog [Scaptodrosophila lebanonensis]|uniref:Nucleolar protein 14 homolog n=1 Tax=Drosophila lebanonensis TaxID=7225 RepID=A0A6J2T763_DROLE|nr:nucleolar protein 14 homolog [Scaptodrosophila lebanonensis]
MGAKHKKANADVVHAKKKTQVINPFETAKPQTARKLNPFDVHVNKKKFEILGRICKHDRGMPGVSRAKAQQRRSQTLGKQFEVKHKTNKFVDNRIGRHLSGDQLTDSVLNARYLADKLSQVRTSSKAEKFNLNDDELLTHRGQTLEEIEQYRDERSDDEDDERLDAEFTAATHFGGDGDAPQDRQAAIEDMITEQKRRKNEIAKEKDEVYDLTERLDANYKELISLVGQTSKEQMREKPPMDSYDRAIKEMTFDRRGTVTDKLIKPEDLAKQEAARLEKLENERLRRMNADGEEETSNVQPKHRSADDLDDSYFVAGLDDEDTTLAYDQDGKLCTHSNFDGESGTNKRDKEVNDSDDDIEEEEKDDSDDSSESDVDNLSDLKESDSDSEQELLPQTPKEKKPQKSNEPASLDTSIPFTIKMPKTYDNFTQLLNKRSVEQQATIVERIMKCNHPKLEGVNRENVIKLYAFLLQYIHELFEDASEDEISEHFQLLSLLVPLMYDLTHLNPERMSNTLLDVIKEKYSTYSKHPKMYPTLDTLVYFKLVSNIYSTSDFRHPLATPTYIFMQDILSHAHVRTRQDISMGILLVTIALEFGQRSKRLLPAVFNYLQGIVHMCIPKQPDEVLEITPPFERNGPFSKLLAIGCSAESKAIEQMPLQATDLVTHTLSLDFKVRVLSATLGLIKDATELVGEHVGATYLATPFLSLLSRLPIESYPAYVNENLNACKNALEQVATRPMKPLAPAEKKPKALRMLEPRFEAVYDDKRRPKMTKEKEERAKLLQKIKREKKGAIREIRRDTVYLQELRIKKQLQSDNERKEKVKRIYQEAAIQQGELNELARANKRKKF